MMTKLFLLSFLVTILLQLIVCQHLGIDVSSANGDIDWHAVRMKNKPRITFAFIRGSEGADPDPRFQTNFEQARKHIFQTKYLHVFRAHEMDNNSGTVHNITVQSQIERIETMMRLINFDKTGREDRAADDIAISILPVAGDSGLTGGLKHGQLFTRLRQLLIGVNKLGVKAILLTDKKYWDQYVTPLTDTNANLHDLTKTLWLQDFEFGGEIDCIPLQVCSCAIEQFAPLINSANGLPIGLSVQTDASKDNQIRGQYYWRFSGKGKVNGVNRTSVGLSMSIYPHQVPRLVCKWSKNGAEKPYPTYPIPSGFTGDYANRGIPYDEYSKRCDVRILNRKTGTLIPFPFAHFAG